MMRNDPIRHVFIWPAVLVVLAISIFPFTIQMPVGVAAEPDRPFDVALDLLRAHLFDRATGQAIPA
jgi:multiple sugar transport system ATP-binding protein